jgi:ABC-type transporter Mla MlaB component
MQLEGDVIYVTGPITLATVPELSAQAQDLLKGAVSIVDFSRATDIDSSAVALALECKRVATRNGTEASLRNLPGAMLNLAKLYGVADLVNQ